MIDPTPRLEFRAVSTITGAVMDEESGSYLEYEDFRRRYANDANVIIEYRFVQGE